MSLPLDQPITLTFHTYSDAAETTLADATTVTVDILDPTGTTTSYTLAAAQVVHASLGTYTFTYTPAAAGVYEYHWHSTGTAVTALDGSLTVDAKYTNVTVTVADFRNYLADQNADATRVGLILRYATQLCESIVNPLPSGAEAVILDVAQRAYAVPPEGVGPFATITPATMGAGGLYLTRDNKATLRRLAGKGGAFTIDTFPAGYALSVPWWDSGNAVYGGFDSGPSS